MAEPTTAAPSRRSVSLTLRVSADRRHLGLLRDMTQQLAAYAGASAPSARGLGQAVDHAVGWLLTYVADTSPTAAIEIQYASTRDDVSACVLCRHAHVEQDPIDAMLARSESLTMFDGLVDRVERGRDETATFCRLTCRLP